MHLFRQCSLIVVIVTVCYFTPGEAQITDPPPGRIPVEANGKLYNVVYLPLHCKDPYIVSAQEIRGGLLLHDRTRKVLMKKYGPYHIQGNIEIDPSSCLVIMPGVKMYFDPGFGIIVNGTLIARVSVQPMFFWHLNIFTVYNCIK